MRATPGSSAGDLSLDGAGPSAEVESLAAELYEGVCGKVIIDIERMNNIFSGIKTLSDKAQQTFVRTTATNKPKLADAFARRDWTEVHSLAHRLKGASGYIAGERVNASAHALQKCAARLMPADPKSSVAEAAIEFATSDELDEVHSGPEPTEALAEAQISVLFRCLDELVSEIQLRNNL